MSRMFITQYKCTTCDFITDRPSAFFAHYRDEHNTEIAVTFSKDETPAVADAGPAHRTLAQRLGGIAYELQETARGWGVAAKADFDRGDMASYDAHLAMSGCYKDAASRIFKALDETR